MASEFRIRSARCLRYSCGKLVEEAGVGVCCVGDGSVLLGSMTKSAYLWGLKRASVIEREGDADGVGSDDDDDGDDDDDPRVLQRSLSSEPWFS